MHPHELRMFQLEQNMYVYPGALQICIQRRGKRRETLWKLHLHPATEHLPNVSWVHGTVVSEAVLVFYTNAVKKQIL